METIIQVAYEWALKEIDAFGVPPKRILDIAIENGQRIAHELKADPGIVHIGTILMDIKLGEAKSHNKPQEHVRMSEEASRAFLKEHNISEGTTNTILSCIREHHNEGGNFSCIESEAVANADCYRFASVQGNFYFVSGLISEGMSLEDAVAFGKSKFEEKMRILSLAWCKQDLEDDIEVLTKLYS